MKKIFEIPEMEVVRFVEADIVVCSDCHKEWSCISYSISDTSYCAPYDSDSPLEDCSSSGANQYSCLIDNDYTNDPYQSHYTG